MVTLILVSCYFTEPDEAELIFYIWYSSLRHCVTLHFVIRSFHLVKMKASFF